MTNIIQEDKNGGQKNLLTGGGVPKDLDQRRHAQEEKRRMSPVLPPPSHDLVRCIHPPFAECYAVQAFSIASDFNSKLMPKEQNQITMRNVCVVIQSLLLRRLNHHSSYSQDPEKHHTLLTSIQRVNIVLDVERHELFGIDTGRSLPNVTPKRSNPLAVVEGVQRCFFLATAAAETIGHAKPALNAQSERGNALRPVSENSELFKKPELGAQFH